jgi:hypothetical protein
MTQIFDVEYEFWVGIGSELRDLAKTRKSRRLKF